MKKQISIPAVDEITTIQYINLIKNSGDTDQYYKILFDIDKEELQYIDDTQLLLLNRELHSIIDNISKFDETQIIDKFIFNNKKYKLKKKSSITNEEYLALTELSKNVNENLAEITSILFQTYEKKSIFKIWRKIDDENIEDKILIFNLLPFKFSLSAVFFCLILKMKLIQKEMKRMKMKI